MTQRTLFALIVLIAFCLAPSVFAKLEDDGPTRLGFHIVTFNPLGDVPKNIKSNWMGLAADWHRKWDEDGNPTQYITLGYAGTGRDSGRTGSEIMLTQTKLHRRPVTDTRTSYMGYGYGLYWLELTQPGSFMSPTIHESAFRPGIHILYGQEFKQSYFAEIRMDLQPNFLGSQWGGIYLNFGTRLSL